MGIPGAVISLLIAMATLVALFVVDPAYQKVVAAAAVWFVLGLVYFAVHAKRQLVYSPEERVATSEQKAKPQTRRG